MHPLAASCCRSRSSTTTVPRHRPLVLRLEDTAYVEAAQACGLHLSSRRDPERATSYGVGQLISAAIDDGARTIVVGVGGLATNDGGAGLLAALGASAAPAEALTGGPHSSRCLTPSSWARRASAAPRWLS
ncbi:MAG: glycerate kinase [Nocardioidaceae bacterium]